MIEIDDKYFLKKTLSKKNMIKNFNIKSLKGEDIGHSNEKIRYNDIDYKRILCPELVTEIPVAYLDCWEILNDLLSDKFGIDNK